MNKRNIILFFIFSVSVFLGTFYTFKYFSEKEFAAIRERSKQKSEQNKIGEEQSMEESIAPISSGKPIIFSDKEKNLLENLAPAESQSKELDPKMQELLKSIQPK